MTELALSIVFDNTNCFKNLDKQQTKMLLLTCKDAKLNENIEKMRVKYVATNLFQNLDTSVTSLMFAHYNSDLAKIEKTQSQIVTILNDVYARNDAVSDAFKMLTISEYKEQIYNSINDPTFEMVEMDILYTLDEIINENPELFDVYNHQHDPSHFIFEDRKVEYSFYEQVEKDGGYILDEWEMSAENDDEF
jgi:peroxiredoxin